MYMWWVIAAGACVAASWLVFVDGAVAARRVQLPYHFAMYAPAVLALCGTFVSLFVNVAQLTRPHARDDDDDDVDDDSGVPCSGMQRNQSLFFAAAVLLFGSVALAVWKATDPYLGVDDVWPGVALLVHTLLLIAGDVLLLVAKAQRQAHGDDDSLVL